MQLPPRPAHPLMANHYVVAAPIYSDDGAKMLVATCSCGWRFGAHQADQAQVPDAVETHWQAVIAGGVAGRLARAP